MSSSSLQVMLEHGPFCFTATVPTVPHATEVLDYFKGWIAKYPIEDASKAVAQMIVAKAAEVQAAGPPTPQAVRAADINAIVAKLSAPVEKAADQVVAAPAPAPAAVEKAMAQVQALGNVNAQQQLAALVTQGLPGIPSTGLAVSLGPVSGPPAGNLKQRVLENCIKMQTENPDRLRALLKQFNSPRVTVMPDDQLGAFLKALEA